MPFPAAVGTGLYDAASTTALATPGDVYVFDQDEGKVYARYMQNKQGASVAAGLVVGYDVEQHAFVTDHIANTLGMQNLIAGVLMTSVASDAYAWVAFRGGVTQGHVTVTHDSTTVVDFLTVDASGHLNTALTSSAITNDMAFRRGVGLYRTETVTRAAGTGQGGVIELLWR